MWKTSKAALAKRIAWRGFIMQVLFMSVLIGAVAAGAFLYGRSQSIAGLEGRDRESLQLYAEALDTVRDDYVGKENLDPEKQTYGAIEGMLDSLGDEGHTRFQTAKEAENNRAGLSGKYIGVGIQLSDEKEGIVVASPVEGSPAEEAGIESGDVLVAVDGKEVGEKKAAEIVGDVKGKKGTMVELTVRRDGKERDFEMQRAEIKSPIASWYLIPDSETAHVRLTSFSDDSAEELSRVLDEARAGGAKRFILDVRDNPGGRLDQAEKISSEFLETGKVIYIREDADGDREEIKVKDGAERVKAPLVVLVNQGSASSSEILAGALRDNDRAEVIGKTTFGTGTVLSEFTLSDDSSILLGVAEWLTPDGDFIRESGIDPDIEVKLGKDSDPVTPNEAKDMSADEILEGDAQLRRAFEEVSQK
jgi:carboxyl-terminal processing protease